MRTITGAWLCSCWAVANLQSASSGPWPAGPDDATALLQTRAEAAPAEVPPDVVFKPLPFESLDPLQAPAGVQGKKDERKEDSAVTLQGEVEASEAEESGRGTSFGDSDQGAAAVPMQTDGRKGQEEGKVGVSIPDKGFGEPRQIKVSVTMPTRSVPLNLKKPEDGDAKTAKSKLFRGKDEAFKGGKKNRQTMVNEFDLQYLAEVRVGGQRLKGILDTGSFELVVFSTACQTCNTASKYDNEKSKYYQPGVLHTVQSYGSGDTYSMEAFDMVSIGPFSATNQSFWEVIDANMPILSTAKFEAIIGVGPPETPAADAWYYALNSVRNVSESFINGSAVAEATTSRASQKVDVAIEMSAMTPMLNTFQINMFSVCIGAKAGSDGVFIWNDTSPLDNPALFTRVPVIGQHTWTVDVSNVHLSHIRGDGSFVHVGCGDTGCGAIVDSGTSLIVMPTFAIDRLTDGMARLNTNCSNLDELPDLVFEIGGKSFSLPPDAYIAEVAGDAPDRVQGYARQRSLQRPGMRCELLVMESFADTHFGPLWILGMPFFRSYYTTFSIGKSRQDRALYISAADSECFPSEAPATHQLAAGQKAPRKLDLSKMYLPRRVTEATTSSFVHL